MSHDRQFIERVANELPDSSVYRIILGNPAASFTQDGGVYMRDQQMLAVTKGLALGEQMMRQKNDAAIEYLMMLDHPHRTRCSGGRMRRKALLDPANNPSLAMAKWPRGDWLREELKAQLGGLLAGSSQVTLPDVLVLPEESIFWYMSGQLRVQRGYPRYRLRDTTRELYSMGPHDMYVPKCIAVFAGALELAAQMDFKPKANQTAQSDSVAIHATPRSAPAVVLGFFQRDATRVTHGLLTAARDFAISPDGLQLPASHIRAWLSDEGTVEIQAS